MLVKTDLVQIQRKQASDKKISGSINKKNNRGQLLNLELFFHDAIKV